MKRKLLALVLSLLMIIPSVHSVSAASVTDISGHWAEKEIQYFVDKGYIVGYSDASFRPDRSVTRAEFVRIVNNAYGFTNRAALTFSDVRANDWFYADVACAVANGFISGYGDNTFRPNNPITREETAAIIQRLTQLPYDTDHATKTYTDVSASSHYNGIIGALTSTGIMKGVTATTFAPTSLETRADTAYSLYNALMHGNGKNEVVDGNLIVRQSSYGPSSDADIEQISGNAYIRSQQQHVTVKNVSVVGDFVIEAGTKQVTLQNVSIKGNLIIKGGTDITLKNTTVRVAELNNPANSTSLELTSDSSINDINVYSSCTLTEDTNAYSSGFNNVVVKQRTADNTANTRVDLYGRFVAVDVYEPNATVNLNRGDISDLYFYHTAEAATANLKSDTFVTNVEINAAKVSVRGSGSIENAKIEAEKATFEQHPNNVSGSYAPSYDDEEDDDDEYKLVITVHNGNGAPVEDAKVVVDDITKTTDSEGKAKFATMSNGTHDYKITHSRFSSASGSVSVSSSSTTKKTVKISSSSTYTLTFRTEDYDTGSNVNSAKITLKDLDDYEHTSGGEAEFDDLEPGVYKYTVVKSGYKTVTDSVTISSGNKTVDIRLREGTSTDDDEDDEDYDLVITVHNRNGAPVEDADVKVGSTTRTTDSDGKAKFATMSNGTHDYKITHSRFSTAEGTVKVSSSTTKKTVTISGKNTYSLTIYTEDYDTGSNVNSAKVKLEVGDSENSSSGKVLFDDLEPGVYTYTVSKSGYRSQTNTVTISNGNKTETVRLRTGSSDDDDDGDYALVMTVKNRTGAPVEGATVKVGSTSKTTNSSGEAKFSSLSKGSHSYTVSHSRFSSNSGSVSVSSSSTTRKSVTLSSSNKYSLTIYTQEYSNGNNVNNAKVVIDGVDTLYSSSGKVTLSSAEPGVYTYTVSKSGYTSVTNSVTITSSNKTETVRLRGGGSSSDEYYVNFYVVDPNGDYLSGARVTIDSRTATTNSSGYASISDLSAGTHSYTVAASGYTTHTGTIRVTSSGTTEYVTMGSSKYVARVTVTDDSNNAISGAVVNLGSMSATTNSSGLASFSSVSSGSHTLKVTANGYNAYSDYMVIEGSPDTTKVKEVSLTPNGLLTLNVYGGSGVNLEDVVYYVTVTDLDTYKVINPSHSVNDVWTYNVARGKTYEVVVNVRTSDYEADPQTTTITMDSASKTTSVVIEPLYN